MIWYCCEWWVKEREHFIWFQFKSDSETGTETGWKKLNKIVVEAKNEFTAEVKKHLQKRTSFVSNTQSGAEKVKSLKTEGLWKPSTKLDGFLADTQVDWWPKAASTEFPVECFPVICKQLTRATLNGKGGSYTTQKIEHI